MGRLNDDGGHVPGWRAEVAGFVYGAFSTVDGVDGLVVVGEFKWRRYRWREMATMAHSNKAKKKKAISFWNEGL